MLVVDQWPGLVIPDRETSLLLFLSYFLRTFFEVIEWDRVENHVAGKRKGRGMLQVMITSTFHYGMLIMTTAPVLVQKLKSSLCDKDTINNTKRY